jgi:hypothetical protein
MGLLLLEPLSPVMVPLLNDSDFGKAIRTGAAELSSTNTQSKLLSFVSSERTVAGVNAVGGFFLNTITTRSGRRVRDPKERDSSSKYLRW